MQESGIVVGLCGCDACQAALRYAICEARWRGCRLIVVVAYGETRSSAAAGAGAASEDLAAEAEATARRCLELAGTTTPLDGLDSQVVTREMLPVDALAAAAQNADAMVVGRHHGQPAAGKPVGTTTRHLVDHSPIPVISVPRGYE